MNNHLDSIYSRNPEAFAGSYVRYLQSLLDKVNPAEVADFIRILLEARERGATVFFIGNGGSAATASHFANDLAIGTNDYAKPFRVISLANNASVMTAIGNDHGFEEIFVRQLRVLGKKGDILVGISASGNSPNLVKAFEYASSAGIETFAITAFDGGRLKQIAGSGFHIPTGPKEYGPAEDIHMILDHLVGAYLMRFVKIT